jgi:hypothetical protein
VEDPSACYYHQAKKFNYWKITAKNQDFFSNHDKYSECPFRGGMNQLWRDTLLALGIEQDGNQPFKHATFSVVRHPRNNALNGTLANFQHIIDGNPKFTTLTSADIIAAAAAQADDILRAWIEWYVELYDI